MDNVTIWTLLLKGLQETLDKYNFTMFYPNNKKTPELPLITETDDGKYLAFSNKTNSIKILYENNRFSLFFSGSPLDENGFADFLREEQVLLESETANDRDIKWLAKEFSESIIKTFGSNSDFSSAKKKKLPQTVSKSAAKNGTASYDPVTLASRFTVVYPELRDQYRANIDKYDGSDNPFHSEEFFMDYGTPAVMETIRENNPQKMKKLFNLLNDIFEEGTNETQSLVAVTILGEMYKDKQLLQNAKPYMSENLGKSVSEVCKYLSSFRSSSDRAKLLNPPAYKPRKKKGSLMSRMMGGR